MLTVKDVFKIFIRSRLSVQKNQYSRYENSDIFPYENYTGSPSISIEAVKMQTVKDVFKLAFFQGQMFENILLQSRLFFFLFCILPRLSDWKYMYLYYSRGT
jgi:hypothetical protein